MTNIVVPQLGESVVEARVAKWLKKEGDRVEVGEPVVELETEKIDLEVGADHSGILTSIKHKEGDDVKVGELLAIVDETGAAAAADAPPAAGEPTPTSPEGAEAAPDRAEPDSPAPADSGGPSAPTAAAEEPKATPTARRMAREHEVNIGALQGSGAAGRVTKQDVRNALGSEDRAAKAPVAPAGEAKIAPTSEARIAPTSEAKIAPSSEEKIAPTNEVRIAPGEAKPAPTGAAKTPRSPAGDRTEERVRMSKRRETIARRLVEAQRTAAMLTTFNELDMTSLMALRERRKEAFKKQYSVGLGIASFFVKASVAALKGFPQLNAEIQGNEIVLKHYYDIGMAVGAEGGLVVPVLRDADRMSFVDIERAIRDYAQRASDGTLTLDDLTGGTFTITNGGVFGSLLSTPILNPPQVGILGLHKIEERPVAVNGQVIVRPMMYVALSYDHRIVDGREAVQFLVKVKEFIEDPGHLLLES